MVGRVGIGGREGRGRAGEGRAHEDDGFEHVRAGKGAVARHGRAKVVSDHGKDRGMAQGVDERDDVVDEVAHAERGEVVGVLDSLLGSRASETTLVRGDDVEAFVCDGLDDLAPGKESSGKPWRRRTSGAGSVEGWGGWHSKMNISRSLTATVLVVVRDMVEAGEWRWPPFTHHTQTADPRRRPDGVNASVGRTVQLIYNSGVYRGHS